MLDIILGAILMASPETNDQSEEAQPSPVEQTLVYSEYERTLAEADTINMTDADEGEVVIVTVRNGRTQRETIQAVQYDPEESGLGH